MAGFGSSQTTKNRGVGSWGAGVKKGTSSSWGANRPSPKPVAQPQQTQQRGPAIQQAGPGRGGGGHNLLGQTTQTTIKPPPIPKVGKITVGAERNPDLDRQLQDQRDYVDQLKKNTSFASDNLALGMADRAEGAKNAAKYMGGAGGAGMREARQGQIADSTARATAGAQANMLLGREQMIGNFMNQQINPIMAQQQGMLGQQGLGLQAEGLRQNFQNQLFGQGLAGQQLQLQGAGHNLNVNNSNFNNAMQLQQYLNPYRSMQA